MSMEQFFREWTRLALKPDGAEPVEPLTMEVLYDWTEVHAFCDQFSVVDRDGLIAAIRKGFKPIYPMGIGDGNWKPAQQPMSVSCSFDYEGFRRQNQVEAVGDQRTVQLRTEQGWRSTEMSAIKQGDVFRMFEPDGKAVLLKGAIQLRAAEDAACTDGVWGVQADPLFDLHVPAGAGCGDGVTGD